MFKKILIHTKKSIKFAVLFAIAIFLIVGVVSFFYKPTYSVWLNGEQVGYTEKKSELQERINKYIEKGNGNNVAFVQVENLPEYDLCLLKRDVVPNDEEIFNKIKESGTPYYRYYAIAENNEEKSYVSTFEEAESIVNALKEKESKNVDNISIVEKYETETKEFAKAEDVVNSLYVEKKVTEQNTVISKNVNTGASFGSGAANLGITLERPVEGTISSRFGAVSSIRSSAHTGLDISAPTGTPISAAAAGVVVMASYKGSYGNMLVISHGNGVQTYYCHCSRIYASVGDSVDQGEVVATVGSTGNSTGPHLHLEVRVNGVAYNPQNYVY